MLEPFFDDNPFTNLTALEATTNLILALALALVLSSVYRYTHSGYSYSRSFNTTLVSVTMTITMIMMIIGNYWVLSLGLVGALSVVRFRTAIKDARDIAYLFLSIAIGLACSTSNYVISVLGTAIICGTLVVLHRVRFGAQATGGYVLSFLLDGTEGALDAVQVAADNLAIDLDFRSFAEYPDRRGEYVFNVDLNGTSEQALVDALNRNVPGISHISLIAPESTVEL